MGLALASRLGRIRIDWKTQSLRLSLPRARTPRWLPEHQNRGRRSLATACCRGPSTDRVSRSGRMWSGEAPESPKDTVPESGAINNGVCLASTAVSSGVALRSDRPTHPGGIFAAPCASVRLSPSTRERLSLTLAWIPMEEERPNENASALPENSGIFALSAPWSLCGSKSYRGVCREVSRSIVYSAFVD